MGTAALGRARIFVDRSSSIPADAGIRRDIDSSLALRLRGGLYICESSDGGCGGPAVGWS